jgi:predicted enzyme related to lactoylglutathione lyase
VIARLNGFALDCPDPRTLGAFYQQITGWELDPHNDDQWVTLINPDGGPNLSFQRVDGHTPPQWPSNEHPAQAHLDFEVSNLDDAEAQVVALGARVLDAATQPARFRVYADPAGHPFCLFSR